MRAKIIISALAILVLFLVGSCAKPSVAPTVVPAELEECEITANEDTKSKCYLYAGVRFLNEKYCKKSKFDANECYMSLAVTKKDISFCDNIPVKSAEEAEKWGQSPTFWRNLCYATFVMRVSFNAEHCSKISDEAARERCISAANKLKDCETTETIYRDSCYVAHALAEMDLNICEAIVTTEFQENCKDQVHLSIAQMNDDVSECFKMSTQNFESVCLQSLSVMRGDGGLLCEKTPEDYKNTCYENYATARLDPKICDKIIKRAWMAQQEALFVSDKRDSCLISVAIGTLDKEVCRKVVSDRLRESCLKLIWS